jgi:hypothetical protein
MRVTAHGNGRRRDREVKKEIISRSRVEKHRSSPFRVVPIQAVMELKETDSACRCWSFSRFCDCCSMVHCTLHPQLIPGRPFPSMALGTLLIAVAKGFMLRVLF